MSLCHIQQQGRIAILSGLFNKVRGIFRNLGKANGNNDPDNGQPVEKNERQKDDAPDDDAERKHPRQGNQGADLDALSPDSRRESQEQNGKRNKSNEADQDAQYRVAKNTVSPGLMRIKENTASTSINVEAKT